MNDMSGRFFAGTRIDNPIGDLAFGPSRLSSPQAFVEATALVEDALVQLRAAEHALERQLGDLRAYLRTAAAPAG